MKAPETTENQSYQHQGGQPSVLRRELVDMLGNRFMMLLQINYIRNVVRLLHSTSYSEFIGNEYNWDDFLTAGAAYFLDSEDAQKLTKSLSGKALFENKERFNGKQSHLVRLQGEEDVWVSVKVYYKGGSLAWISIENGDKEELITSIIHNYVFKEADFFVYLDTANNRSIIFNGKDDMQAHTFSGDRLESMKCFIDKHVVPEDKEFCLKLADPEYVLNMLKNDDTWEVTFGINMHETGYHRKQISFRMYDRSRKEILVYLSDVTDMYLEQKHEEEALDSAIIRARTEPLTGLYNVTGMKEQIRRRLSTDCCGALFFIDLDNFKVVNDKLGHKTGDDCLGDVAQVLRRETRSTDIIGRIGGDEFIIYLPEIETAEDACDSAERICSSMQNVSDKYGKDIGLTCSIGITMYPEDGADYDTLVRKADSLVYQVKHNNKNSYAMLRTGDARE